MFPLPAISECETYLNPIFFSKCGKWVGFSAPVKMCSAYFKMREGLYVKNNISAILISMYMILNRMHIYLVINLGYSNF